MKSMNSTKKGTKYLASLQQESAEPSMAQSSESSSANKISIKRPVKPSSMLYGKINIPTFVPGDFNCMDKAIALHEYLMSKE